MCLHLLQTVGICVEEYKIFDEEIFEFLESVFCFV